jgi:outer membrane immunogenic protein
VGHGHLPKSKTEPMGKFSMRRFVMALKTLFLSIAAMTALAAPALAQSPPNIVNGSNSASGSSWVAGAQGGYNWQTGSVVYGFETDFSFTNLKSSMTGGVSCFDNAGASVPCSTYSPTPSENTSSSVDWYGTVRGRLGWATGPILLYGTGGLAYGKVNLNSNFNVTAIDPSFSLNAQTSSVKAGWVLGGGIDYMLRPNVLVNLGYQYVDLGSVSVASSAAGCTGNCTATQNASAHARFQVVTLGLNWRFTPTNAASQSWEGGYIGGHGGGDWGNNTNGNGNGNLKLVNCFTGATQILMADGTTRPFAAVKIGDEVLGENGEINKVVDIETHLGKRKLYAFNDGIPFVTADHPFMTRTGWKSILPETTLAANQDLSVGALKVGDEVVLLDTIMRRPKSMTVAFSSMALEPSVGLLVETKFLALDAIVSHDGDPSTIVYNLRLDGNQTYFANNYLVHN